MIAVDDFQRFLDPNRQWKRQPDLYCTMHIHPAARACHMSIQSTSRPEDLLLHHAVGGLIQLLHAEKRPSSHLPIFKAGTPYCGYWDTALGFVSQRKMYLRSDELAILFQLSNSDPLNKYQLMKKCKMHQTQVVRGVKRLLGRQALMVACKKRWRTGKISSSYRLTSAGRFFLLFDEREKRTTLDLLKGIEDYAAYYRSSVIVGLANSVKKIEDEKVRSNHTRILLYLAFELQDRLSEAGWQLPAACEFVRRAWASVGDIVAYLGNFSKECRCLLRLTKEDLAQDAKRIDFFLTQRKISEYT